MSHPDHIAVLLDALESLHEAAADNLERTRAIQARVGDLRDRIEAGEPLVTAVEDEEPPRIVELLTTNMAVLETAGADFRFAEASALREEGLTIEAIATLFGVTRQRISALLRQRPPAGTVT